MAIKYVKEFKTPLKNAGGRRIATLLWGDPVHVLSSSGESVKVRARGMMGWVPEAALSNKSLLEIYVIDVGQGDSVFLKTPDGKWHLIDAGVANRDQMTKKGAANFLRWKFQTDLGQREVLLASVILTHPDYDHYGGLLDVLAGKLFDGRTLPIKVGKFYHSGLGRFKGSPGLGKSAHGKVEPFPGGYHGIQRRGTFIAELLDGKDSFSNPPRELRDTFEECAALVGRVPCDVHRLSHRDRHVPGYGPRQNAVTIRVLGPILEEFAPGRFGFRRLGSDSVTGNGHSVVLRLDYGQARILLTGDLNARSQKLLLSYHSEAEFAVDVAKGCHHGSEDVDMDFMRTLKARATVISSGDNEDYAHPRPSLIGASGRYGREAESPEGRMLPPLVYSTELARSVRLAYAASVRVDLDGEPGGLPRTVKPENTKVKARRTRAKYRSLEHTPLSTDLIYGLVNVRTDGVHILCATMEEKGTDFDVKVFKAEG